MEADATQSYISSLPDISEYVMLVARYALPFLAVWVLGRCLRSMLRERYEPETWGYLVSGRGESFPINHWECIIGRSKTCDVTLDSQKVSPVHAALQRNDVGEWTVHDLRSFGGTLINGEDADEGWILEDGDVLDFAGECLTFRDIDEASRAALQARRTPPGRFIGPGVTLLILTLFQAFLALEFTVTADADHVFVIALAFFALIVTQWLCYLIMRSMRRTGFEPEIIAFFLTTLGVAVVASSAPDEMFKQMVLMLIGIALFFILGWWLRDLRRVRAFRWVAGLAALALLAVNVLSSEAVFGAKNWLTIGGVSLQPSELVKVIYVYTGAATLDRLYERRTLFLFIGFSAVCVIALALIGDFGAALIFFTTFLVISFMRSGSFATVFLAVSGAGLAGFLAVSVRPYIAQRFASWGHVWEDAFGAGYQQTHAMSAAASGGLFGQGAGNGALKSIFAANTDMVFAMVCEELGLIVAVGAIFGIIILALFAVRNAAQGRSTYYVIAGCAAVSMMMVQLALNVFGTLDILPFTGVTFPFVSKGGTSLISCWMLLAFVKSTDTRRDASFVVRPAASRRAVAANPADEEADDE